MILKTIFISNVRNVKNVTIDLGQRFNIFYGHNGAGKSSILEAIYLLSTGKSFRTHQIKKIISYDESNLVVFAKKIETNGSLTSLGLSKSSESYEIRINGENVKSISDLAIRLPVLVTTQDSHKLIDSGPQWRRQFIDWGLFHVKHDFLMIWKRYNKLIKQRNSALINECGSEELEIWNNSLAEYGELYNECRISFIEDFKPYFIEFSRYLLGENEYNLEYIKGWPKQFSYLECLKIYSDKDRQFRRTEYGPHRADIRIDLNQHNSRDTASRGQQKLLVYALNLALIAYLEEQKSVKTLMLLDDLGSELDSEHAGKLLGLLWERFSQVCITTANLKTLPLEQYNDLKMFHVEHGEIIEVSN